MYFMTTNLINLYKKIKYINLWINQKDKNMI